MQYASFYPHQADAIQKEETHISMVFLTGSTVYKLKKPVQFGFLDFSTLALRKHYCDREVALNRRLSNKVYQKVVPITLEENRYCLNGSGTVVEYAVQMKQLPSDKVMKRLLAAGGIETADFKRLIRKLVAFYQSAATGESIDKMGSVAAIENNCEENFLQTFEFRGEILDSNSYDAIRQATRDFLKKHSESFQRRIEQHHIRDGHGDLRSGHIYFVADQIQIIDCIEFNQRFRNVDVIADLAFLLMDMEYLGHVEAAQTLYSLYLSESKDRQSAGILSFYKCYRAMVRIKVNCLRLGQRDLTDKQRLTLTTQARRYLSLAERYAGIFGRPSIWIVCGLIATGKSTVANALAQAIEATVCSSDRIRKKLAQSSGPVPFGEGIYTEDFTRLTYEKLFEIALQSVAEGDSVVLDATFGNPAYRKAMVSAARQRQIPLFWVECRCPESVIRRRLKARESERDLDSDARIEHFESIRIRYQAPKELDPEFLIRIHTESELEDNLYAVLARFL